MGVFRILDPIAYVIAFEQEDRVTYHGRSTFGEQTALRYYLSPFDEVLDIYRNPDEFAGHERSISVRPVDAFRPGAMMRPGGQPVIGCVHLAWRVREGADPPGWFAGCGPVHSSRTGVR
jgi:hypothetical protein